MKIAIQENMLPGNDLKEKFLNAKKFGYEGIEIWGRGLLENSEKVKEVKKASLEVGIKISTICAGYRGSLLDSPKEEREKATKDIITLIKISDELQAVGVIVVPVFGGPKLSDVSPFMNVRELEKRLLVEELKNISKEIKDCTSVVLLEPLNRYETHFLNRLEQAKEICQELNHPNIKIMADFFHMSIEEAKIPESIEKHQDLIYHFHLADSNRILPGCGHTDFVSSFAVIKKNGYKYFLALECGIVGDPYVELPKCAEYLRNL